MRACVCVCVCGLVRETTVSSLIMQRSLSESVKGIIIVSDGCMFLTIKPHLDVLGKCNIGFFSSWAILHSMVLEECGFEVVCLCFFSFFSKLNGLSTSVTFVFAITVHKGQNVNSRY